MDLSRTPEAHRAFLAGAMPVLEADARFVGVAAGGSWISGKLDEFSDLDLVLVSAPAEGESIRRSRLAIAGSLGTLLSGFTGEHVGEPRLIICLYENPLLHVDLKFVSLDDFADRVEDPVVLWEREQALTRAMATRAAVFPAPDRQWLEDRFWVWVHYAATKLGRGELFEVIDFLASLRALVLGPLAAMRQGHLPRGMRKLEALMPSSVEAFERTLAARNAKSCANAVSAAVELYRELREGDSATPLVRRSEAERAATEYLASIAARVG